MRQIIERPAPVSYDTLAATERAHNQLLDRIIDHARARSLNLSAGFEIPASDKWLLEQSAVRVAAARSGYQEYCRRVVQGRHRVIYQEKSA